MVMGQWQHAELYFLPRTLGECPIANRPPEQEEFQAKLAS